MPKVAETIIQSALHADPLTVAIVFLGLIACGLIWLASLAITTSKRR
jgi:hypothetical protein